MEFLSNDLLLRVIERADPDDLRPIFEQLHHPFSPTYPADYLVKMISQAGGHSFLNLYRNHRESVGYLEILYDVMDTLKISYPTESRKQAREFDRRMPSAVKAAFLSQGGQMIDEGMRDLEQLILEHIAQGLWAKMTPVERASFERNLALILAQHGQSPNKLIFGTGGALLLGNLGGFGTYMVVSALLHTVSFGLLSFGAYAAVSSILAIALGPVGWTALAGYAVFKFGSPNMKRLIPIVVTIALIRRKNM